jgi:isopentenyl-diphosphate delta-isomerase
MSNTAGHDEVQLQFMANDECILVNESDEEIGHTSKKDCHIWSNIQLGGSLHRAFSVFLFNDKGELLLQQRAAEKITFPLFWTNTCCSHPLHNEADERDGEKGVKIAARRKLEHELGIPQSQIDLDRFHYMTRILYQSSSLDSEWGEHEVDYCLIYQLNKGETITVVPNSNEIGDFKWVSKEKLVEMMNDNTLLFTPWFKLIVERFLFKWWAAMLEGRLEEHKDTRTVHNMMK